MCLLPAGIDRAGLRLNLPWLAVGLLSAAALAYEVLLTRLFAIAFWHHFAHLIISLALLGYGMSGSFLAFAKPALERRFGTAFSANVAFFTVSAPLCVAFAQHLGFNPLALAWEPGHWVRFGAIYLLLALPFFAAANAIALALWIKSTAIHRIYAADLVGAGLGALGVLVLLFALDVAEALRVVTLLGCLALGTAVVQMRSSQKGRWLWTAGALALIALSIPDRWVAPVPSQYKDLSQALSVAGARIVAKRTGPMSELVAVENGEVPFRIAPGMSLSRGRPVPEQVAVYADGDLVGPVSRRDGSDPGAGAYLEELPSALPYFLFGTHFPEREPEVLVLGAGTGEGVAQALRLGARRVVATEKNPALLKLVRDDLGGVSDGLFDDERVSAYPVSERAFAAASGDDFDLVVMNVAGGAVAGLGTATETPELTRESMDRFYAHLKPGGMLVLSHPTSAPPRLALKLALTLMRTSEGQGGSPADSLLVARGWRHAVMVLKKGPFTDAELGAARDFTRERSFDLAYMRGLSRDETNQYNRLPTPQMYDGIVALLGPARDAFVDDYKFDLREARDDRPFAYDFFRWSAYEELSAQARSGAVAQMEWGYIVLVVTFIQAIVLSLVLILLPVLVGARQVAPVRASGARRYTAAVVGYFGAVGVGFLAVEIAYVHSLQHLLHHPVFAVSTVLAAFLVFAGLGSITGPRVHARLGRGRLWPLVLGISVAGLVPFMLVPVLSDVAATWPLPGRILVSLALMAPLAFMMGMPFPNGLRALSDIAPGRLPLAWAVNGCASVVAAVGAQWVALAWGFGATLALGLLMYGVAAPAFRVLDCDRTAGEPPARA